MTQEQILKATIVNQNAARIYAEQLFDDVIYCEDTINDAVKIALAIYDKVNATL